MLGTRLLEGCPVDSFDFLQVHGIYLLKASRSALGAAHQCLTLVLGQGQSGRGVKLITPSSYEVENEWRCTFALGMCP